MKIKNSIIKIIFFILLSTNQAFAQEQIPNIEIDLKGIAKTVNKVVGTQLNPNSQTQENSAEIKKNDEVNTNEKAENISSEKPRKIPTPISKKTENPSLMYSDEEMAKIQEAIDALAEGKPLIYSSQELNDLTNSSENSEDNAKSYIYLGSILYNSPKNWSAWINDQKITPNDNKAGNELYIKSINEEKARIIWTMSISKWKILTKNKSDAGAPINKNNQVELDFTLGFNQTYMLGNGKIVEGRISSLFTNKASTNNALSNPKNINSNLK